MTFGGSLPPINLGVQGVTQGDHPNQMDGITNHESSQKTRFPMMFNRWTPPKGDEAHFWLNGYVNKQNCCIWSEANPQVYVETPLHPEKLTVWCALWAGGILLQK
ncbi:hypothetical protein TNCV_3387441 [Trichonephila clavipes]|nr:hypothetical protein TNCV_3387441 [Trichonephila clavipes]